MPLIWAPFAEGLKGMFDEPILKEIAEKYNKTVAQIILRWNVQQGVIVIPKSVHRERMRENFDIWNFKIEDDYPTTNLESVSRKALVITYDIGGSSENAKPFGLIVYKINLQGIIDVIGRVEKM